MSVEENKPVEAEKKSELAKDYLHLFGK